MNDEWKELGILIIIYGIAIVIVTVVYLAIMAGMEILF